MTLYAKLYSCLLLSSLLFTFSCNKKVDLLEAAKDQLNTNNYIRYTETAMYPIPESDLVDTFITQTQFLIDQNDPLGYHFIQMSDRSDCIYQNDRLQVASHKDRLVRTYLPKHFENTSKFKEEVESNFRKRWSPMALLQQEWKYVADTVVNDSKLKNYSRLEGERVYEGKQIRTEQHIFINSSALLERFERRNYLDGSLSQRVVIEYSNFDMTKDAEDMSYDLPKNYVSTFGKAKPVESLKEGELAPAFAGINLEGDPINNSQFAGKKVLLNFSVTTCGYCKMALDYMNQEDYVLSEDVEMLYINPEDDRSRMESYMKKISIPYPVIASAEDIAKAYRVTSYPRFFLIDEKGKIEKIQVGYSKEFLDKLRQKI